MKKQTYREKYNHFTSKPSEAHQHQLFSVLATTTYLIIPTEILPA